MVRIHLPPARSHVQTGVFKTVAEFLAMLGLTVRLFHGEALFSEPREHGYRIPEVNHVTGTLIELINRHQPLYRSMVRPALTSVTYISPSCAT